MSIKHQTLSISSKQRVVSFSVQLVLKDALMESLTFGLGKVLPGQRAGAQW